MEKKSSKKTMGRRKIEIKKIEKKTSLQVTFTKRRHGLFRKASELAILSGAEIAILVQSPAEKVYTFGHPSVEAVINRVEPTSAAFRGQIIRHGDNGRSQYEQVEKMLEVEKSMNGEMILGGGFWWEKPFEGMELHELELFLEALEGLRQNVEGRVEEFEKFAAPSIQQQQVGAADSASSYLLPFDQYQDTSVHQVCDADSASSYLLPFDQYQDTSVHQDCDANSASSYLLPFDQDQDTSVHQVCDANSASSYLLHQDQDQDISIQQVFAADSASSYLLQPFDQDQDIFDLLNQLDFAQD